MSSRDRRSLNRTVVLPAIVIGLAIALACFTLIVLVLSAVAYQKGVNSYIINAAAVAGANTTSNTFLAASYGAWYISLLENVTLEPGDIVPFDTVEVASGITNDGAGTFTLPSTATYMALYSTESCCFDYSFDLVLGTEDGEALISGSEFNADSQFLAQGPNPLTVMFAASAGDTVVLRYTDSQPSGHSALLSDTGSGDKMIYGPNVAKQPLAYIVFQQLTR
jgi:hypothetical protein